MFLARTPYTLPFIFNTRYLSTVAVKPVLSWKNAKERDKDNRFMNSRLIRVKAGNGGDGMSCFSGIFLKEFAGPDGGNGGKGGDIVIRSSRKVADLSHIMASNVAGNGMPGRSACRTGKSGKAIIIPVPLRTVVRDVDENCTLAVLRNQGDEFIVAYGGAGGRGNAEFLSNENRAPDIWERGEHGEARNLELEMEKFADFGLIGMPNAGKSTLLRVVSRAYPQIADYPFTTLYPQLGVVEFTDHCIMSLAEIPGLIEGSWLNKGNGRMFLKHARACECLLFMVDLSETEPSPIEQLHLLMSELAKYDHELLNRAPLIVAANKIDSIEGKTQWPYFRSQLARQMPQILVLSVSVRERINLVKLLLTMRLVLDKLIENNKQLQALQPIM